MINLGTHSLQYIVTILVGVLTIALSTGCSSGKAHSVAVQPSPTRSATPNPSPQVNSPWVLETISTEPLSYRRIKPDNANGSQAFLTLIEECGSKQAKINPSTGRQLLVGFDQLQIDRIDSREVSGTTYVRTVATAVNEDLPVTIVSYSDALLNCVRDNVLWFTGTATPAPGSAELDSEIAMFELQLQAMKSGA